VRPEVMLRRYPAALVILLTLNACNSGPDFSPPEWLSPASWFANKAEQISKAQSVPVAEPIDPNWWNVFHDRQLTALEHRIAGENLDVQVATARLAESRAQLGITGAAQYPNINANASYEKDKASNSGVFASAPNALGANGALGNTAGGLKSSKLAAFDIYQGGFDASWELDLWGNIRRAVESARASVEASAEARRATLISSQAELARDYVQLRGAQLELKISRDNLRTAEQGLQLTQQRAAGGVTTDLDVANAAAQVRTTAAQIPPLEQRESEFINAISLLLGLPPNALQKELIPAKPVPPVPPRVPVGVPSEWARRRPDIRQAEAQLHAATAEIGVSVANFYPQVTLSGSLGFQALQPNKVFDVNALQFAAGPSISVPIFQGGQLRATLELSKAQQKEAAINYQKTVLNAWTEVDNALTAYQTEQARRNQLTQAVAENERALSLAQSRYQDGVADFLQVLTAEENLLSTQQQLAISTTNVSANLVALYKALGGGWETQMPRANDKLSPLGAPRWPKL
jgi:NodT family efflux transporter outer membrane factor (OMF) lipoprotein